MDTEPLYPRLIAALRQRGQAARGPFFASHRDLARELDCSAGALPPLMERAVADGVITRRRYQNTFRLALIDQFRSFGQERPDGLIDHTDRSPDAADRSAPTIPAIAADPAAPSAAGRAEPAVIDRISAHKVHDIKQEEGEVGAPPVVTADTSFAHLGVHPTKERELHAAGVTPGRLRQLIARKAAEGARSPLGAAIAAACAGLTAGDWRQEERSPDGPPHAPAGRPPAHQPARPGGRRGAAAGPSAAFADPTAYYELLPGGT